MCLSTWLVGDWVWMERVMMHTNLLRLYAIYFLVCQGHEHHNYEMPYRNKASVAIEDRETLLHSGMRKSLLPSCSIWKSMDTRWKMNSDPCRANSHSCVNYRVNSSGTIIEPIIPWVCIKHFLFVFIISWRIEEKTLWMAEIQTVKWWCRRPD